MRNKDYKIAVIGLGYVGLPLAVEFSKKYLTVGFDINKKRVAELNNLVDFTLEVSSANLADTILSDSVVTGNEKKGLHVTENIENISKCNIYIITVPTPTDKYNHPDLTPLYKASETVGKVLKEGDIVIYESTVYPGVTEDECVPVLEKISGLQFNKNFYAGYSPERINPGDKEHTVTKILKVTSGSTPEVAEVIDQLYKSIITAGTHKASSIKVAEAAKVIENTQRDINIAFINELSKIFNLMGIDTLEVLAAAGTKWNFLKFSPGLVGGHCIGVDPHYLAQKAQEVGYHPEIILAGRRLNDGMGQYVANEVIKLMIKKDLVINNAKCLILGFTFKENCPDTRNTKVIDIITELKTYNTIPVIFDPWANKDEVTHEYGLDILTDLAEVAESGFEAVIMAVGHNDFKNLNIRNFLKSDAGVIFDVKGILDKTIIDGRL
jgi:UDP-N-acetyl-D-galactosamine dehydrogenase